MKKLRVLYSVIALAAVFLFAGSNVFAQGETLNNNEVISLIKAGLSETVVISKIRSSKGSYDLSTNGLIALKKAGVGDGVIAAMLDAKNGGSMPASSNPSGASNARGGDPNDPAAPHDFGIYLYQEKDGKRKMTQLSPSVSAQNRTGGLFTASITPLGLGKVKTKANLPGTAAAVQLSEAKPVFYFYLDSKTGGLNTSSGIPSSTNEFTLVKFNVRSDNREITIAKSNAYGAKGGLSDESVMSFETENLGNGVYKVTPTNALKNGEYGFYLINSGGSNASAAVGAKFFDFGVKLNP